VPVTSFAAQSHQQKPCREFPDTVMWARWFSINHLFANKFHPEKTNQKYE